MTETAPAYGLWMGATDEGVHLYRPMTSTHTDG